MDGVCRADIDFRSVVETSTVAMVITDIDHGDNIIVYANHAFEQITGYRREEIIGRDCRFLQGAETDQAVVGDIRAALRTGQAITRELLNYRSDGTPFWNELSVSPRHDAAGRLIGFLGIQLDVSARRRATQSWLEAQARLDSIIENIPGFVYQRVLHADGSIDFPYLSPAFARLLGLPDAAVGAWSEAAVRSRMDGADMAVVSRAMADSAAAMAVLNLEFRVVAPDGEERWVRSQSQPRRVGDDVVWDAVAIDVTAEKAAQARLTFLAYNDPLTGLSNRSLFMQSLQAAIATAADADRLALLHIDLCGLQHINEAMGRTAGDAVLRTVALRLTELTRRHPGLVVARTAGDEFAAFGPARGPGASARLADSLAQSLGAAAPAGLREIDIMVCIGFVTGPPPAVAGASAEAAAAELARQADVALAFAKRVGPGACVAYESQADDQVRHRMQLKQSLPRALHQREFVMHYQPFVDLRSGRVVGAEALLRWHHPELGMQRPDLFLPVAEETGLIVPLGEWVIRDVMRQARDWREAGLRVPQLSINVSGKQLQRQNLPDTLQRALAEFGGEAADFDLELTEGVLIDPSPERVGMLDRIRDLGFSLAVDDFGTGYSSLLYLKHLPVDKLKIDQAFVRRMVVESSDAAIIRAIIAMARSLNLEIVAEGIETELQRDFLRDEGCRIGQGYLFSLPLVAEDFGWLIANRVVLPAGGGPGRRPARGGRGRAARRAGPPP